LYEFCSERNARHSSCCRRQRNLFRLELEHRSPHLRVMQGNARVDVLLYEHIIGCFAESCSLQRGMQMLIIPPMLTGCRYSGPALSKGLSYLPGCSQSASGFVRSRIMPTRPQISLPVRFLRRRAKALPTSSPSFCVNFSDTFAWTSIPQAAFHEALAPAQSRCRRYLIPEPNPEDDIVGLKLYFTRPTHFYVPCAIIF
jgi:hypothetical protein